MSELIPEEGACRIVFESTDKDDDNCLDDESYLDQSETSRCQDDSRFAYKTCPTNFKLQRTQKRKKGNEPSCDAECTANKKRKKLLAVRRISIDEKLMFQKFSHMPNLLESNNNNTIIKRISQKCENDSLHIMTPNLAEGGNNTFIIPESYLEMTDAVRKLTEVLVLPINQTNQKESNIFCENTLISDKASFNGTGTVLKDKTHSSFLSPGRLDQNDIKNPLRMFRLHKQSIKDDGLKQTLPTPEKKKNKISYDSDDATDFNLAVEALNLLKNKGRIYPSSEENNEAKAQVPLDTICSSVSDKLKATIGSLLPNSSIDMSSGENCDFCSSNTEASNSKHRLIFDSTLEITDCTTGAKIPFASIYQQSNNDFYKYNDIEPKISHQKQNESQNEKCTITSTLTQLSDTVTCVKIPLQKSILSIQDQESLTKQSVCSYSTRRGTDDTQTDCCVPIGTTVNISKNCVSSSKITMSKKNKQKAKSLIQQRIESLTKPKENKQSIQETNQSSNPSQNLTKIPPNVSDKKTKKSKLLSKLRIKKLPLESRLKPKNYDDQIEEMRKNIETRWSSQTSKTSETCPEYSVENQSPIREDRRIKDDSKKPDDEMPDILLSSSELTDQKINDDNQGNVDKIQKYFLSLNSPVERRQLNEEENFKEKTHPSACFEKARTPLEAFNLIITDDMILRIVKYTNEKLLKFSNKEKPRFCGYKKAANEIELRAFLGLLLISAALKQNNVIVSELWSECFGAGIYRATLQEGRFYVLLQNVCFADISSGDKISEKEDFKIGDPWDEYVYNCKIYPMPLVDIKAHNKTDDDDSRHLYTTVRKTTNLALRILFSMLDAAVVRGSAIYQNENPKSGMCIRTFLKQVGMNLVRPQLEGRLSKPTIGNSMRELIQCILNRKSEGSNRIALPVVDQSLRKQKRCQLCSWNKDRKTRHQCICCQRNMCKEHRAQICIQCVESI